MARQLPSIEIGKVRDLLEILVDVDEYWRGKSIRAGIDNDPDSRRAQEVGTHLAFGHGVAVTAYNAVLELYAKTQGKEVQKLDLALEPGTYGLRMDKSDIRTSLKQYRMKQKLGEYLSELIR
jgi:hypothetical protein